MRRLLGVVASTIVISHLMFTQLLAADDLIAVQAVILRLQDFVEVPARQSGVIDSLTAKEGGVVVANQMLGKLDDTDVVLAEQRATQELEIAELQATDRIRVEIAKKAVAVDEALLNRAVAARKSSPTAVSESELDRLRLTSERSQAEVKQAERDLAVALLSKRLKMTAVEVARRDLRMRKIVAPTGGMIVKVYHQPGEWVEAGEKVIRLLRIDTLRAEGFISVLDAERIQPGAVVQLKVMLGKDVLETQGKVAFISPEVEPVNGQVRLMAEVENASGRLRPGVRAEMQVVVPSKTPVAAAEKP